MPKWPDSISWNDDSDAGAVNISPAERRLLASEVTDKIRDAILAGQLQPGQRLREEHLASVLGVSRGPVREALTQLEREGLVVKFTNRATIVARLTPEDVEEVYSLRLALERLAITRVVARAQDAEIDQLQEIVNRMDAAVEQNVDPAQAAQLDLEFHELLVGLSRHRRLKEAWTNLQSQTKILLLSRNTAALDFRELLTQGHQSVVDAIRRRDAATARQLMEDHMWGSYVRVLQGQGVPVPKRDSGVTD